jgi:hypothetical protein
MKKDGLNYLMVNVIGTNGYSFMVTTKYDDTDDLDVLDSCFYKGLFQDSHDIKSAVVERMVDEHDLKFFEGITYNID